MFRNIFNGRYGFDNLSLALLIGAALFINGRYTRFIGIAMLAYALFRMFSRNTSKRYQELQKFNVIFNRFKPFFDRLLMGISSGTRDIRRKYASRKSRYQQRKQYLFIKCPKCKNTLRLPKNIGKLQVTCPVCKEGFLKKT